MSRREYFKEENRIKTTAAIFSIVLAMTVVVFAFVFNIYNKKLRENARNSLLELGQVNAVVPNQIKPENMTLQPVSTSQDKGINEVKNEVVAKHDETKIEKSIDSENEIETDTVDSAEQYGERETTEGNALPEVENFEPSFLAPVSGEIIKDFAVDSLVYSKTLDEWTTHYGIDIRADKMTVVAASESGTVESIKNDPRYRTYNYNFTSCRI